MPTLVTGGTGYLAGHVIEELLRSGHEVRATVRSTDDPQPTAHLRRIADGVGGALEVVEADLGSDRGWDAAVAGCEAVLHVASPFPATVPRDASSVVRPAVDGTRRVLGASARAGVRRVVVTSSIAAIVAGRPSGEERVRTEADWTDPDRAAPYARSKTLAERAAWAFAAEHPGTEVAALNPGMILGPLHHPAAGTSVAVVRRLLGREVLAVPNLAFATVDVRDVAAAQRLAVESPHAAGHRYILAGETVSLGRMAEILHEAFGAEGYRVPRRRMPSWAVRVLARFDPGVRVGLDHLDRAERVSAERARDELGWTARDARTSIVDTGRSLIDHDLVRRPRAAPRV